MTPIRKQLSHWDPNTILQHILVVIMFFGGFTIFFLPPLTAQEPQSVDTLPPIIISASAFPRSLDKTPGSITIIKKEDLMWQHAIHFRDILNQVPGVFVDSMGSRGGISSAYIRGGDPNFTTILLDGVRINDPTNQRGGSVDFSTISPDAIDRIEVIKGPLSGLYGSDAMAGVINIITFPEEYTDTTTISAEGGTFGYAKGFIQASGFHNNVRYRGSAVFTRNDEQVQGDHYQLATLGGTLKWDRGQSMKAQFTGYYSDTNTQGFPEGSGGPRLALLRDTEDRHTQTLTLGMDFTHRSSPAWQQKVSLQAFWQNQDVTNPGVLSAPEIFQIPPTQFTTRYHQYKLSYDHDLQILPIWRLMSGIQLMYEEGVRNGLQDLRVFGFPNPQSTTFNQNRFTTAGFLQSTLSPVSWFTVTTSLRVDVPEKFPSQVTPQIGVIVHLPSQWNLRANYGKGFKLPSFNALADPAIGNENLFPETSTGWDIGLYFQSEREIIQLELTYFHNRFFNLIDLDPLLAQQNQFQLTNLQTVTTQGVETSISFRPLESILLKGYVTWVDHQIKNTNESLRNRPRISGGWITQITPLPNLVLRSDVRGVGKRFDLQIPTNDNRVAGYLHARLAITYRVNKAWEWYGVIDNLTDANYEEFLGFPAAGISYRVGVTTSL